MNLQIVFTISEEHKNKIDTSESPWLFEAIASYAAGQFYHPGRFNTCAKDSIPR